MVVALVQFNVDGASVVDVLAFLKVTTTTNVFADDETVKGVPSRREVLVLAKVETVVNPLSTRAIAARAGAGHENMARPRLTDEINRHKRFEGFFRGLLFIGQFCILLTFHSIFLCGAAEQDD